MNFQKQNIVKDGKNNMWYPKEYPKYIEVPNNYWEISYNIEYVIVKGEKNGKSKSRDCRE